MDKDMYEQLFPYLDANNQRAWERYGIICRKLITFFENNKNVDAVEGTIKTFNRVLKNINTRKINQIPILDNYFLYTARYIFKELNREAKKRSKSIDDLPPGQAPVTDHKVEEEENQERQKKEQRLDCLEKCMEKLKKNEQELIIDYYNCSKKERIKIRKNLAKKLNMTINALRIKATRLREKLRKCLCECLGQQYAY